MRAMTNDQCAVSIIIPVYNVGNYLERCLDSILEQTFREYEVILVDDGSTDQSGGICDRYAAADGRFRVLHQKNAGVSAARNAGIEIARGEYFAFFDGDDFVKKECLQEVYEAASRNKADSVIFGYYLVEKDRITETHLPSFRQEIYEGKEILEKVVPRFIGVSYQDIGRWIAGDSQAFGKDNTALWHQLVRGDLIRHQGIRFDTRLKVGEDTCFTTEYLSASKKCCVIQKCYYHLVVRSSSTIYQYEKNPEAVLNGKKALLRGRRDLTERIRRRTGTDISTLWYGTVVMSILQLTMLFARPSKQLSFTERYRLCKSYLKEPETQKALRQLPLKGIHLKAIPFAMLKCGLFPLIFLGGSILGKISWQFKRTG